uniref:tRNA (cytosine(34)-C(5))-methyltransferase, mitochondrial isoform X2 n=1 Tax=Myxine glutinosa TaxID=7769 RepID=UPI00358F5597
MPLLELLPKRFCCSLAIDMKLKGVPQAKTKTTARTGRLKGGKEKVICQPVLEHFDAVYRQQLGSLWDEARSILLSPQKWQYSALLNGFALYGQDRHTDLPACYSDKELLVPSNGQSPSSSSPGPSSMAWPPLMMYNGDSEGTCSFLKLPGSTVNQRGAHVAFAPPGRRFERPRFQPGYLKPYFVLSAASLVAACALALKPNETCLDLCSAPGGKAIALLQCTTPALLCCNEPSPLRNLRLRHTLESYVPQEVLQPMVHITAKDGCWFGKAQPETYDRVLADVPCSNDRSWLYNSETDKVRERIAWRSDLPSLQANLLHSALRTLRPGGTVLYVTCTLSLLENDGVVDAVSKESGNVEVEDPSDVLSAFPDMFRAFGPGHEIARHGILLLPTEAYPWGPLYLSRLRRSH